MIQCACGQMARVRLYVHYKYPRTNWLPGAMDPFNVHGGGYSIITCGNPQCEPDALLACREQIISSSGLSGERAVALELDVFV